MNLPLVSGVVLWAIITAGVATVVGSLFPLGRRRLVLMALVASSSLVITLLVNHEATTAGLIVPALPWYTLLWAWAVLFALGWSVVGWRSGRHSSRILAGVAVPATLLMALALFNAFFDYIPTVGGLFGNRSADYATSVQQRAVVSSVRDPGIAVSPGAVVHDPNPLAPLSRSSTALHPTPVTAATDAREDLATQMRRSLHGLIVPFRADPRTSHFATGAGLVYLPPAWWGPDRSRLPVVELLGGTPGTPIEWVRGANVQEAADAFATLHDGEAPVLVMVNDNGSFLGDTECVDRPGVLAETYALDDVRASAIAQFHLTSDSRRWGVAGLSEGGTCALAIGLRHPTSFGVVGDFSGEPRQTIGSAQRTLRALFGGNLQRERSYDPEVLLRHPARRNPPIMFVVGDQDPEQPSIESQADLARRAGIPTRLDVVSGGHTYYAWDEAVQRFLPFAWTALTDSHGSTRPRPPHPRPPAVNARPTPDRFGEPPLPAPTRPRRTP